MKKGFTIIELLVVMAILIAVTTGSVISYTRMTKDMKVKEYNRVIEEFEAAAEVYVASNYALRQRVYSEEGYVVVTLKKLDSEGLINLLKQNDPVTGNSFNGNNYINLYLDNENNIHAEYMGEANYVFRNSKEMENIPVNSEYGREEMLEYLIGYYKGSFDETTGTYKNERINTDNVRISILDITDEANPEEVTKVLTTSEYLNHIYEITYSYDFPDGEKTVVRKVKVSAYTESLLNGTDPVIAGNLIPIILTSNSQDWTVTYADINEEWYKYEKSEWANAVLLKPNPSQAYNAGDIIKHEDISAYFVWIPRYKYRLFNIGNYNSTTTDQIINNNRLIDIVFGMDSTTDTDASCATPMTSGESGNCVVGKYMTHPAFISFNSNGFWVGKFETTGNINSITVLPGVSPLKEQTIMNMFVSSYNYNRILDSHMMKNTEWGAVAYLTSSIYGRGNTEIWINNNSNYITGCIGDSKSSASKAECSNKWHETLGNNGSTTNNISGIFDMVGGVDEYVAGYLYGKLLNSGFESDSISLYDEKYFDIYSSLSTTAAYKYRILGDATSEMGPFYVQGDDRISSWYGDRAQFVYTSKSWFLRGGYRGSGSTTGIYSFSRDTGEASNIHGFRLVLAP